MAFNDPPTRLGLQSFETLDSYRYRRCLIGVEEHVGLPDGFRDGPGDPPPIYQFDEDFFKQVKRRLQSPELRLAEMDRSGVAAHLVSLSEPGCQGFTTSQMDRAIDFGRRANDWLAETYTRAHPKRFFGLATVPTGDGEAAAAELERCVKELGFKGCLINGFTPTDDPVKPLYLDDPKLRPFWRKAQELDVPVFLHPRPPVLSTFLLGQNYPGMLTAPFGFGRECAEHALRLMCSGLFDELPRLKSLTFLLPRADARLRLMKQGASGPHKRPLRYYFENNFIIGTSGHFTSSALANVQAEMPIESLTYADDYPFESSREHADWFRTVPMSEQTWRTVAYRNAQRLFKLDLDLDADFDSLPFVIRPGLPNPPIEKEW